MADDDLIAKLDEKNALKQKLMEAHRKIDEDGETIECLRAILDARLGHLDHVRSTIYKELIALREMLFQQELAHNSGNNYIPDMVVSLEYVAQLCNREFFIASADNPGAEPDSEQQDGALMALSQLAKAKQEAVQMKVNLERRFREQASKKQFELDQLQRRMDSMQADADLKLEAQRYQHMKDLDDLRKMHTEESEKLTSAFQAERLQFRSFVEEMKEKEEKVTQLFKQKLDQRDAHIQSLSDKLAAKETENSQLQAEIEDLKSQIEQLKSQATRRPFVHRSTEPSPSPDSFFLTSGAAALNEPPSQKPIQIRSSKPPSASAVPPPAPPPMLVPRTHPESVIVGPPAVSRSGGTNSAKPTPKSSAGKSLSSPTAAAAPTNPGKPKPPTRENLGSAQQRLSRAGDAPEKATADSPDWDSKGTQQSSHGGRPPSSSAMSAAITVPEPGPATDSSQGTLVVRPQSRGEAIRPDSRGSIERLLQSQSQSADKMRENMESEKIENLQKLLQDSESEKMDLTAKLSEIAQKYRESLDAQIKSNSEVSGLRTELEVTFKKNFDLESLVLKLRDEIEKSNDERVKLREMNHRLREGSHSRRGSAGSGSGSARGSARKLSPKMSAPKLNVPLVNTSPGPSSPFISSIREWNGSDSERENPLPGGALIPTTRQGSASLNKSRSRNRIVPPDSARSEGDHLINSFADFPAFGTDPTTRNPPDPAPSSSSEFFITVPNDSDNLLPNSTNEKAIFVLTQIEKSFLQMSVADQNDFVSKSRKALGVLFGLISADLQRLAMSRQSKNRSGENTRSGSRSGMFDESFAGFDSVIVPNEDDFEPLEGKTAPLASRRQSPVGSPKNATATGGGSRKNLASRSRSPFDEFSRSRGSTKLMEDSGGGGGGASTRFPQISTPLPSFVRFDTDDIDAPILAGSGENSNPALKITQSILSPRLNSPPRTREGQLLPSTAPAGSLFTSDRSFTPAPVDHVPTASSLLTPVLNRRDVESLRTALVGQRANTVRATTAPDGPSPRLPAVSREPQLPPPPRSIINNIGGGGGGRSDSPLFREYPNYVTYELDPDYLARGTPPSSATPSRPSTTKQQPQQQQPAADFLPPPPQPAQSVSPRRGPLDGTRNSVTVLRETRLLPTNKRDSFSVAISTFGPKATKEKRKAYQLQIEEKALWRE